MIGFDEAQRPVLAAARTLDSESVTLLDAVKRITSRSSHARDDLVPFARSAMDGYPVASADTLCGSGQLFVREPIYAERSSPRSHARG